MNLKNMSNSYQKRFPDFDKTPKSVVAAIAFSFALQICEDDFKKAEQLIQEEWRILNQNNIVPQKAPKGKAAPSFER